MNVKSMIKMRTKRGGDLKWLTWRLCGVPRHLYGSVCKRGENFVVTYLVSGVTVR